MFSLINTVHIKSNYLREYITRSPAIFLQIRAAILHFPYEKKKNRNTRNHTKPTTEQRRRSQMRYNRSPFSCQLNCMDSPYLPCQAPDRSAVVTPVTVSKRMQRQPILFLPASPGITRVTWTKESVLQFFFTEFILANKSGF